MTPFRPNIPFADILRRAYRPSPTLARLLEAILRALAEHTQAVEGKLRIAGVGAVVLGRNGREITVDFRPEAPGLHPGLRPVEPGGAPGAGAADAHADYTGSVDDAVAAAEWHAPAAHHAPAARM